MSPVSKDFLRALVVGIGVMISGLGLSLVFLVRTSPFDFLMLLAAPVSAVALLHRKHWIHVIAFVFLLASVYGVGRIAAETARSLLYDLPYPRSAGRYAFELFIYVIYASVWVWLWQKRKTGARA